MTTGKSRGRTMGERSGQKTGSAPLIEITDYDFKGRHNMVGFINSTLAEVFGRAARYSEGKDFEYPYVCLYMNEDGDYILHLFTGPAEPGEKRWLWKPWHQAKQFWTGLPMKGYGWATSRR